MKNDNYPFEWNNLYPVINDRLKNLDSISFFATIGSKNIAHDVDVIMIKNPKNSASQYFSDTHYLLDFINTWIKTSYDRKLIKVSRFVNQEETLYLGDYKKGDLVLHLMGYQSYAQFKDIWTADIALSESIDALLKNSDMIKGNSNTLDYLKSQPKKEHDSLIYKLQEYDKIHSNYLESLMLKCMNETFRYIGKHINSDKKYFANNESEARSIIYTLANVIDETNK